MKIKKTILLALFVLLILSSLSTGYFYWQLHRLKNNPTAAALDENKALIANVGKLILLPDEQPTVATVTDPSALSDQIFFANAQVGDKVLVYSTAKKAILYNPTTNKIIEVGPVGDAEASASTGTANDTKSTTPKSETKKK